MRWIIGTGGALTKLPGRENLLSSIFSLKKDFLLPNREAALLYDNDYIMASLGCMSKRYPDAALKLLKKSLGLKRR